MNYWIVLQHFRGADRDPIPRLFATPFQAETFVKQRCTRTYTYSVRPATWQEREEFLFVGCDDEPAVYQPPVWVAENWWQEVAHTMKVHFVHVSVADDSMIAFTEDEAKGEADRQTLMKPGKYLQKFLGAGDGGAIEHGPLKGWPAQVTKQQIAYYAAWHKDGKRPASDETLHFAETEEEMVRVYEEGPSSCMKKGWGFDGHPVRVYAAGDLQLAYLNNASGEVVARALCWPKNKVFGRCYPNVDNDETRRLQQEIAARLKALGWASIGERRDVFDGARLQRIDHPRGYGYLMPYLDNDYGVYLSFNGGEEHWVMSRSERHQDSQNTHYIDDDGDDGEYDDDRWTCDECGDSYNENDESSTTVYSGWRQREVTNPARGAVYGRSFGENYWCEGCVENNAFRCDGTEEYYSYDQTDCVQTDYTSYQRTWFDANGGWTCTISEQNYLREDAEPITLATGELVHEGTIDDGEVFQCLATGLYWEACIMSEVVPGYHEGFDECTPHPIEEERVVPVPHEDEEAWALAHADIPFLAPAPQADLFIAEPVVDARWPDTAIEDWAADLRQHMDDAEFGALNELVAMTAPSHA